MGGDEVKVEVETEELEVEVEEEIPSLPDPLRRFIERPLGSETEVTPGERFSLRSR